jgi:hypothetical protein
MPKPKDANDAIEKAARMAARIGWRWAMDRLLL